MSSFIGRRCASLEAFRHFCCVIDEEGGGGGGITGQRRVMRGGISR